MQMVSSDAIVDTYCFTAEVKIGSRVVLMAAVWPVAGVRWAKRDK